MYFTHCFHAPVFSIVLAATAPALLSAACCCDAPALAAETVPAPAEGGRAKPYPLNTCIVSGDAFDSEAGETITKTYNGREITFCCKDCVSKYEKDPAKYDAKLDAAVQAAKDEEAAAAAPSAQPKPTNEDEHAAHHD